DVGLPRRIADAGERPLRVPPGELAVIDAGGQVDAIAGVFGDVQAVVDRVGGARRNQTHVGDGARAPRVPLVDDVAVLVEQQAAIEVRLRIDRPFTVVGHRAAVQNRAALVVLRFQFDPDVEGVNRAAGEEVADLARAHDDLEPYGVAAPDRDVDLVERSDDVRRRREVVLRGAEVHRLLADRERARQPRLGRADSGGGGL